jgi:hypothetical protein
MVRTVCRLPEVMLGPDLPGDRLPTPGKSRYRLYEVELHFSGLRVNQDLGTTEP